ncbi:MAG TPA: ATP-dependent Clp protease ATP-binding subunit ClpA, partial [Sorangium sp.]|nr:ATP-dependent Clp protease ATP-binding subunit ClpA [Sorangium sp.]
MRISPEVEIAVTLATREAIRRRHEYVTVDHLLYALLFDDSVASLVKRLGGNVRKLKRQLETFLDEESAALAEGSDMPPTLSLGFQRVLSRALAHVQNSGEDEVTGANVLVALYSEDDTQGRALLEDSGISRLDVVRFISHGVADDDDNTAALASRELVDGSEQEQDEGNKADPLDAFTVNLNAQAAEGNI